MKYFKNTELAKLYSVSEKTVRNWVQAALDGKLDLQLHHENGRPFVANLSRNTVMIESLVKNGKKYKNTRGYKLLKPSPKFYELYSPKQVLDIISNLDIYREIPFQYSYFNGGAVKWDEYTKQLATSNSPNSLKNTQELLRLDAEYLDALLEGYSKVNIIDIGVGNGMPAQDLIRHFLNQGRLKRYIAIDISSELLEIAERNIQSWFNGTVNYEGHVRDINYERFDDLIVNESFTDGNDKTVNLMLFLGGTVSNFRQPTHPLTTIHDSMGKNDLLLFTKKLDSPRSRRYFDGNSILALDMVLELLNVDKSYYTIEQFFDEKKMARQVEARLKIALSIEFEFEGQKRLIELNKDESILLVRILHQTALDTINQFDKNDFELIQSSRSLVGDYLLTISKIKAHSL